jgi:hypothetical protein
MSEQIFIRMRGRIQGPFNKDQLQSMTRRGQFSRLHEVSTDGVTWSRAPMHSELFPPAKEAPTAESVPTAVENSPAAPTPPSVGATRDDVWYYYQSGSTLGPVGFSHLLQMSSAGQLVGEDLVWQAGTPEWIHAGRVPGLIRPVAPSAAPSAPQQIAAPNQQYAEPKEPPRVSALAVASLVLGILWLGGLGSLLVWFLEHSN